MGSGSPDGGRVELALPAESGSVAEARLAVGELARRVGAPEADVRLAVSEAVGNAINHAFRDRPRGTIMVRAEADDGQLTISVADNGSGMRPNLDSPGLGLGISLITKMASDVRFDSTDAGTTVAMRFDCARSQVGR